MPTLHLTTTFHGNLSYSSIPESKYTEIINKCYWPIVSLVEELNIKLGLEFPAKTLEIIQKLDSKLIKKIKQLIKEKKIEFIGSGYVQSIFPLIPAKVNQKNLEIGNKIYEKILGIKPKIAFVNEHVYSKGLIELYLKEGYESIIIDWVNSATHNQELIGCKYFSTKIKGINEEKINVIWNNSIFFQKLQKYVYGDLNLKEYINFIKSNKDKKEDRTIMVYGNDMEIFNFRPRDPKTLHSGDIKKDEIKKIKIAFKKLKEEKNIEFIFPSDSNKLCFLDKTFNVGTAEAPIITKKQNKYNVLRWAVAGKNNYKSNSLCYKVYKLLIKQEKSSTAYWKRLVELWASDFRTHTEKEKWKNFRNNLNLLIKEIQPILKGEKENPIKSIEFKNNKIETNTIILELSKKKGGTIKNLIFKNTSKKSLIKTLDQGYYEDISHAVDLFSGHTIIFNKNKQITDISNTNIKAEEFKEYIKIICKTNIKKIGTIKKEYFVYKNKPQLDLAIIIGLNKKIKPTFLRTMITTVNPEAFNKKELFYKTLNGGFKEV